MIIEVGMNGVKIGGIMTGNPITTAVEVMLAKKIKAWVVLEVNNHIIGILEIFDR